MKSEKAGTVDLPSWCAAYLENGDRSGVSDQDEDDLAYFLADEYYSEGWRRLKFKWGNYEEFNTLPAFGLPCETIACVVYATREEA